MKLNRALNLLIILALVSAFLASPAIAQQPDTLDKNQLKSLTDGAPAATDEASLAQTESHASTGLAVPLVPVEGTTGPLPGWHESDSAPRYLQAAPQTNHILNPWGEGTPIPTGAQYQGAAVTIDNENFYLIGGTTTTYLDQNLHYNTTNGVWTTRANMLLPRANIFAYYNSGDGMIYVPGGFDGFYRNENHRYNPTTNTWEVLAPLPIAKSGANGGIVAGKLYLFGGNGGAESNETQVYHIASNSWSLGAPMPVTAHRFGGNVTYQGMIYVMGSFDAAHFLRYDPASNTWQQGPDMTVPRNSPNCLVTQDGIITCWGGGDGWTPRNNGEFYDLANWPDGSWTAINDDPIPYNTVRAGHTCASDRLWVEGGQTPQHDHNQWWDGGVSCYLGDDYIPGEWVNIGLGSGCPDFNRSDAEYFPDTGLAYILGGRSGAETHGDIYTFDPNTESCQDTGVDLPTPVSNYTIATLEFPDGYRLCTFGGRDPVGNPVNTVQCYSPAMNNVVTKADLPAAFNGYTPGGVEVVNNRAYIFGGFGPTVSPPMTDVTYEYNPLTDTYTAMGNLSLARGYMLTAVVNGKIYAFGGNTYDGANLIAETKAERFNPISGNWSDADVLDLPVASGEGRAFGFDSGTGHNLSGKIVLAGGGQWPGQTAEALLYDPASRTYNYSFPDLNVSRRNHAAFFQSRDTLRMWVLGGYSGSDNPPYAPMEFYQIPFTPEINIDPLELWAEVVVDTTEVETLDICNVGTAPLEWKILEMEASPLSVTRSVSLPAGPDAAPGHSTVAAGPFQAHPASTYSLEGLVGVLSRPNVLLVNADEDNDLGSIIQVLLQAYGTLGSVDLFDARYATPSLDQLQDYNVVLTWSNYVYADAIGIGDVLADYVDVGGKVINLMFSMGTHGWKMQGRFMTEAYTAMNGANIFYAESCLGSHDPDHPIMSGVTDVCDSFRLGGSYLTTNSTAIAEWQDGELFVATKDDQTVVSIAGYVGYHNYQWTGQMPDVLHNAILWLADMEPVDFPWLSENPVSGIVPVGECQQVEVTFDASSLEPGNYYANLLLLSNDPLMREFLLPVELIVIEPEPEEFNLFLPVALKN